MRDLVLIFFRILPKQVLLHTVLKLADISSYLPDIQKPRNVLWQIHKRHFIIYVKPQFVIWAKPHKVYSACKVCLF
jgi:hypothetical protein